MKRKRKVVSKRKSKPEPSIQPIAAAPSVEPKAPTVPSDRELIWENSRLLRENVRLASRVAEFEGTHDAFRRKVIGLLNIINMKQGEVAEFAMLFREVAARIEKFKVVRLELRQEITASLLTETQKEAAVLSFPNMTPESAHVQYANNLLELQEEGKVAF